jgi:hypothetical protein
MRQLAWLGVRSAGDGALADPSGWPSSRSPFVFIRHSRTAAGSTAAGGHNHGGVETVSAGGAGAPRRGRRQGLSLLQ